MKPYTERELIEFVRESLRIENILREPTGSELDAHRELWALTEIRVKHMVWFVDRICGAPLRDELGRDVVIRTSSGLFRPPPGTPNMAIHLEEVLALAATGDMTPYATHVEYESLHPFIDGNGRSGRALWAWQMDRAGRNPFHRSFLHEWYYDSLDASRA